MIRTLLLMFAFVCFLVATFAPATKINIIALGLAAWVVTLLPW